MCVGTMMFLKTTKKINKNLVMILIRETLIQIMSYTLTTIWHPSTLANLVVLQSSILKMDFKIVHHLWKAHNQQLQQDQLLGTLEWKGNAHLFLCTFDTMDKNNELFFDVMDRINVIQLDIDKGKQSTWKKKQEKTQVEQKHGNVLANLNTIMYHIFIKDKTFMPASIIF